MLTGVTKFGKVSVFSDLNNLDDISMRQIYVDLCGISEQELHDNLESELHELADAQGVTYDEICKKLRDYYDGYHLHITLSAFTIRLVCLMHSSIRSLAVTGLKRVRLPIWSNY